MRYVFVMASAILALLAVPRPGRGASGHAIQGVGRRGALTSPIVITDPTIAGRFMVGKGPGTGELHPDGTRTTDTSPSFIIDWNRGVAHPPKGLSAYRVTFVIDRRNSGPYVAYYVVDPSTQKGYVYLPGPQDPDYRSNVRLIYRKGIEGNWFYAWTAWEDVVNPLIARVVAKQ